MYMYHNMGKCAFLKIFMCVCMRACVHIYVYKVNQMGTIYNLTQCYMELLAHIFGGFQGSYTVPYLVTCLK